VNIVVTEPLNLAYDVRRALEAIGTVSYGPFDDAALRGELAKCEALMIRLSRFIDARLLNQAPTLRFILTATTGLDHIDLDAAYRAGVRVISLRDCPDEIRDVSATAEHCMGLILALTRRIPSAVAHVISGGWNRDLFWGHQLRGKRLGIVGYGRIGAMVATYATAFGMDVVGFDQDLGKVTAPARPVAFEELLATSDIVTVHVTASPESRQLINSEAVARLKRGALLINTARGFVVDEDAVATAVQNGHLAGVAADVISGEERRHVSANPLIACAQRGYNVIVTPHIGGATVEAIARTELAVVKRLAEILRG
jgi:D-3-phosphoglycerate dehydrogenase